MRKAKRGGDDLTRSLRKNRRACKNGSLVSGRFLGGNNQDVWSGLGDELKSYFSKNVACITLCNGNTVLFSCSGIAMECQGCHLTRFLTSANLVRALNGTTKDHDDLKIEVRHEGSEVHMGFVDKFDLDHNFAVVNVRTFLDVQVGPFQRALEILPQGELLSVWRGVSGQMMAKSVELDGDSRVSEDDVDPKRKNSQEAWEGGPLLSVDGKFVGMNLFFTMRRAVFLPWGTILKPMEHYWTSQQKKTGLAQSKPFKVYRFGSRFIGGKSNSHPEGEHNTGTPEAVNGDLVNQEQLDLDSMGYPKLPSTMLGAGMMLVNTFEEAFGDTHGKGVWRKFSKSANINRNVVALASFNGEKRLFACTGFFIEWNGSMTILTSASLVRDSGDESNIVENLRNLRIEVLLDNKCKEGTLEHCSLHYNVALVSVKDCPPLRPSNTLLHCNKSFKVAAVGRCFKSGTLMATSGRLVSWTGTLDCHFLVRSTCKITKAGIGGPLVNFDGDIIGMNFYDKKIGTPFLLWADICKILSSFETKSTLGDPCFWKMEGDDKINLNRWPVPMPRWCYPGEDKSDTDDELGFVTESGRMQRYGYILGKKVMLL